MSLARLMNQPLQVQPRTGSTTDEYGNTVLAPLGTPVTEAGFLEQKDTIEYLEDRQTVVSKWKAFLPATSVVTPLSTISFQSQTFQVDGQPEHLYNPRTRKVSHIECKLTVVL